MPQFVLGQAIGALASILNSLLELYFWIVLISALLSWVNPDPRNPIVRFLYSATEPVLFWLRRRLPFLLIGGFDLTPLVLLFGIRFVQHVLVTSLYELAVRIGSAAAISVHVV
jgi:YggT family protein